MLLFDSRVLPIGTEKHRLSNFDLSRKSFPRGKIGHAKFQMRPKCASSVNAICRLNSTVVNNIQIYS